MSAPAPDLVPDPFTPIPCSQIAPVPVRWLWEPYLPRGKLVVLDGDPGTGKSFVALDLAARVSAGLPVPGGAAASVEVRDSSVVYTYTTRWALLRLLRQQASAAADFDRFVDPKPHTLKFMIDTRTKPDRAPESANAGTTEAKVFLGVTVMAPGKKEPLLLPPMPVRAPEVPQAPALLSAK